jgi:hypothetical protein
MAKIKFGAMMVDASGKLGGQVFAKNRGGSYIRTKTTPLNPQTTAQMAIRGVFASISSGWSSLTEEGRQSFNNLVSDYARTDVFGDTRNPSGKNLYQRLNQNLAISYQAQISTCVLPSAVPFANLSQVGLDFTGPAITVVTNGDTSGSRIVVWATAPLSAGTKFVKNKLRQIGVYAGGNQEQLNVFDDYIAKFGAFENEDNIYFAVRVINDNGQASPFETVKAIAL